MFPASPSYPSTSAYPAQAEFSNGWLLFAGDSLSHPNLVGDPVRWSQQLAVLPVWERFHELYLTLGGASSAELVSAMNYPPGVGWYFLLVGTNDLPSGVSAATVLANVATLKNAAEDIGYSTVLLEVPKNLTITGDNETARQTVNAGLPGLNPVAVVPCDALLPDASDVNYFTDGIHLTTSGYALISNWINSNVDPLSL